MQRSTFKQLSHPPRVKSAVAISALVGLASLSGVLAGSPVLAAAARFDTNAATPISFLDPSEWTPEGGDVYSTIVGDKKFIIDRVSAVAFTSGNIQTGEISFHSPTTGVYTGLLNFRDFTTGLGLNGPSTGSFTYKIAITDPTQYFDKAWLSTVVEWPGASGSPIRVTKTIDYLDIAAADLAIGPTLDGSSTPMVSLAPMSQYIMVTDTWDVPANGATPPAGTTPVLRSYVNSYSQVPGPLPVLGAGAAFGFSRKLRSRVRLARGV
jgi:hypothetical protein